MIRNLRQVIREKKLNLNGIAMETGIQRSTLELIMLGAYQPNADMRRKIAEAVGELPDPELFESGLSDHKAPLR